MPSKNHHEAGFTLVEIAIVLLIIGVIIGGVIKGKELFDNARLKATIQQINECKIAVIGFEERYGALPGDLAQGNLAPDITYGNGNNRIEGEGLEAGSEAFNFWQHLKAADLFSSTDPTHGVPAAKIGGVITVSYQDGDHWFVLGNIAGNTGNGPLLTPQQAMLIDNIMDNGDPNSGNVRAQAGSGAGERSCVRDSKYNTQNHEKVCTVRIKF